MKQEEEDRALLTSLGITSANPEDIERDVLEEAITNAGGSPETEGPSSNSHKDLYNKLRAVKVEIDAVAHTVDQVKNIARTEDHVSEDENSAERVVKIEEHGDIEPSPNGLTLQEALVADRLKSLKKTKAQLEKELKKAVKVEPSEGNKRDELLRSLVKDDHKQKRKIREEPYSGKRPKKLHKTVSFDEDNDFDSVLNAASAGFVETEKDELVRKGILTPFHKLKGFERRIQEPAGSSNGPSNSQNRRNCPSPSSIDRVVKSMSEAAQARPTTKLLDPQSLPKLDAPTIPFQSLKTPIKVNWSNDSDGDGKKVSKKKKKRPSPGKKWQKKSAKEDKASEETDEVKATNHEEDEQEEVEDSESDENPFVELEGGLKIPENIFSKLFDYQKVGVQWLWELHCQRAGGIIGDEMGLGKTIQVLAFLAALHFSNMYKPSIIVVPVTLLRQWRREAKKWYPNFHVELLHDSAQEPTVKKKKRTESDESDYESEGSLDSEEGKSNSSKKFKKWEALIKRVLRSQSGLLITTYEQLRLLGDELLDIEWGYAVLDEGHRIRNPNAEVTLACKQLQTVHRLIMTGAPIQNKLTELWSLFDFVFPGKLGVLPVFEAEFAVPISVGGYANASPLQVSTAYRCAVVLRDLIMPYLLRRMKADVNAQLTKKTEHVLFCSLTPNQRSVYRAFLASSDVEQIFDGNRNSLYGIDIMRKICNHPDLLEREHAYDNPDYGNPVRSGKMKVIEQVLKVWKEQGHRVLLFSQTQQMLDILESFLEAGGYVYRRMDGQTPVKHRMALIDEFNNSSEVFVFILTTKVGGLGTNLTGANRVIIFDPDWNPSNDLQARERAWRIGQKKDVTVYRLITRGTIEEKVYHRQIYKHFLTNKILKNPQQKRFFKSRDMKDLFTLTDDTEGGSTETSNIFGQISDDINVVGAHKDNQDQQNQNTGATVAAHNGEIRNGENLNDGLPSKKGKEKADQRDGEVDEETNILQSLFDASGIHSAVNHDAIMNAQDEDKTRLEEQANQIAQRAAEALRHSRALRSRESISVPTWTGKSGAAGAPSSIRRKFGSTVNPQLVTTTTTTIKVKEELHDDQGSKTNGIAVGASAGKALSSSELLARIRGNQERAIGDGIEQQMTSNRPARPNRNLTSVPPEMLIRQICTFMQQRGKRSDSASIVQHFRDRIPSKDLPLFKSLLKQIAVLEKNPGGSFWVLKPEYEDQ